MQTTPAQSDRIFRFGSFELSEREGELRKNGVRLKLQEQPFRVLLELLARSGQMVTREELQQKLWPADTFVDFDTGLNTAIRKIRQALEDDADNPKFIETTPRRGYRFLMRVSMSTEAEQEHTTDVVAKAITNVVDALIEQQTSIAPKAPSRTKHQLYYLVIGLGAVVIAVVVAMLLRGKASSSAPIERRITSNPAESPVQAAVISPDGKYLAYSDPTGAFVREIATGDTRPLQLPPDMKAVPDSWYPDSVHLLVTCFRTNRNHPSLWQISILGGSPEQLVDDAAHGLLSRDGKHIAFFRGTGEKIFALGPFPTQQLWTADASGGDAKKIAEAGVSGEPSRCISNIAAAAWSPRALRIAYIEYPCEMVPAAPPSLLTRDARGGDEHLLAQSANFRHALAWSVDGRVIYNEQRETSGMAQYHLSSISVDEKTGKARGSQQQIAVGAGSIQGLSITEDGKHLAIWRDDREGEAFLADVDQKTGDIGTPRRLTFDANANKPHAWMPDSQSVIFESDRSGVWQLYKQAPQDAVPELLVSEGHAYLARLSTDGAYILYLHFDPNAAPDAPIDVMKVSVSDRSRQRIFSAKNIFNMQCARTPSRLCLFSTISWLENETHFFSFDPDTGKRDELFKMDNGPLNWTLSPDGSTIAFLLGAEQKIRMYSVGSRTWSEFQVPGWQAMHSIDWSADGKQLIIPAYDAKSQPVLLGVSPNGAARVLRAAERQEDFLYVIPSPDGKQVAITTVVGDSNVWLRDNF